MRSTYSMHGRLFPGADRVYEKKVIELERAIIYVNYSAYEQLVFIFGKIRLLAIE